MKTRLQEIEKRYARVKAELPKGEKQTPFLLRLYEDLITALSDASQLHFNTLFARVSFVASRYGMHRQWAYALQIPRKEIQYRELGDKALYPIVSAVVKYLLHLLRAEVDPSTGDSTGTFGVRLPKLPHYRRPGLFKKGFVRVVAVEWIREKKRLMVIDEEEPDSPCRLDYAVAEVNDIFADTLESALQEIGLPLVLGLTDVESIAPDHYIPSFIVVLPDLLLDVTSVTTATSDGPEPDAYHAMELFWPSEAKPELLMGQVANYFFDEYLRQPKLTFAALLDKVFRFFPIEFSRMSDDQLRELITKMEAQYHTIAEVVNKRFYAVRIHRERCVIEPSYYSPRFGIKGRLDVFCDGVGKAPATIIELKSSKPFKPNGYGLSESNYRQTLLYDLLIRSVFSWRKKVSSYILYSAETENPLRYAAVVPAIQKETINNRNQLALLNIRMTKLDHDGARDIFAEIDPERFGHLKGFVKRNIETWHKVYAQLTEGEKNYFKSFAAFVTREHMLARLGNERGDGAGGLAGLWLDTQRQKEAQYRILRGLQLKEILEQEHQTLVHFERTDLTNPMANFRAGDIVVMYPYYPAADDNPVSYQLNRASIVSISVDHVVIRLRNVQINTEQIRTWPKWNLEPDVLDSSFRSLYQSLWILMSVHAELRKCILGLTPPPTLADKIVDHQPNLKLTLSQANVYREGLESGFLYLLWGPPGTGKTSIMLRSWVEYYFRHTTKRIALLAYTNRAVDEICDALHHCGEDVANHYIRIGSRSATGEEYRHRLLDHVIEPMTKRIEIRNLLQQTRIYVGTVASILGKNELLNLLDFDVVLMDEASQLLEPNVVGLLTRFRKVILIGDHLQLPAVCVQPPETSLIRQCGEWSEQIGLTDMGMSYFERMYRLYQARGWNHLIGHLHEQGRMHETIMAFANRYVYGGMLQIADEVRQTENIKHRFQNDQEIWLTERLIFVPSRFQLQEIDQKTNAHEASLVIGLISQWKDKLQEHGLNWSIGVITPFRAQIAAILHHAHQEGVDLADITVDTVERYQGGARDIIIMSCACNAQKTLNKITSRNPDGIDRKLNVAVTRARQQFILVGNEEVLSVETGYRMLMEMSTRFLPEWDRIGHQAAT